MVAALIPELIEEFPAGQVRRGDWLRVSGGVPAEWEKAAGVSSGGQTHHPGDGPDLEEADGGTGGRFPRNVNSCLSALNSQSEYLGRRNRISREVSYLRLTDIVAPVNRGWGSSYQKERRTEGPLLLSSAGRRIFALCVGDQCPCCAGERKIFLPTV